MNKPWYIQTTDCYAALKRNELLNDANTQENMKCILLSER